jgi:hypothetical protein
MNLHFLDKINPKFSKLKEAEKPELHYAKHLQNVNKEIVLSVGLVFFESKDSIKKMLCIDNTKYRLYLDISIDSLIVLLTNLKANIPTSTKEWEHPEK